MKQGFFDGDQVIYQITREQLIEDEVLVAVDEAISRPCGLLWPVAVTSTALTFFKRENEPINATNLKPFLLQVANAMRDAKRHGIEGNQLLATILTLQGRREFKIVAGPDDNGLPCLTIMLPEED